MAAALILEGYLTYKKGQKAVSFWISGVAAALLLTMVPGLLAPDPRPLFCRQKRGEKTASPPVPGAGPRAIRGVYGGFLRCKSGKCPASTRRRALRAEWWGTNSAVGRGMPEGPERKSNASAKVVKRKGMVRVV